MHDQEMFAAILAVDAFSDAKVCDILEEIYIYELEESMVLGV